jgi:hypothetical protein
MSTSTALFRGIIGFGAPGAGLAVREGGLEWMRGGTEEEVDDFGLTIIEEMRSDGFDVGRVADSGGEAEEACGRGLAAG